MFAMAEEMKSQRGPHEEALFQSVRNYYSTPQSLSHYGDAAKHGGLHPPERAMVARFMTAPARVLDVGCGAGREAFELVRMGFAVTALDIAAKLLTEAKRIARELGLTVDFRLSDGKSLDFPQESFDYVLLITQMIHHVPFRANRVRLLGEAGRVVKRTGSVLLTYHDWTIEKDHEPWGWRNGRPLREPDSSLFPDPPRATEPGDYFTNDCQGTPTEVLGFCHRFTGPEMEEEVLAAGLEIVQRASFATIAGGEPDDFWKPTQVLLLRPT